MEWFNMSQVTKEMVVARLTEIEDPCDAAAKILEKTLLVTLKEIPELKPGHRQTIVAACQGTMVAIFLKDLNISRGAVRITQTAADVGQRLSIDPAEMMQLAMRGIADIRRFCTAEQVQKIQSAINQEFMGAGAIFNELVKASPPPVGAAGALR